MKAIAVAFVLVCLAAALAVGRLTALPAKVAAVSIENPREHDVEFVLARPGRAAYLAVGTVPARATRTFLEVVDQGDTWVARFSYGGVEVGEVVLQRSELRRQRWRILVPER